MFSYLTMKFLKGVIAWGYLVFIFFVWFTVVTFMPVYIWVGRRVYRIILTLKKGWL